MNKTTPFSIAVIYSILVIMIIASVYAVGVPTGYSNIINVTSWNGSDQTYGTTYTTSGGTISYITVNITQQNTRWKAYVGNVSGTLALQDGSNHSIYDWNLLIPTGELYATRVNETINWNNIRCANATDIFNEQDNLSFTSAQEDNINKTFNYTQHSLFYTGSALLAQNSCFSTALHVNNTEQFTRFQEILLSDGQGLVYASIIENAQYGFNFQRYDFQMIVPDNATVTAAAVPYYFYVEIT